MAIKKPRADEDQSKVKIFRSKITGRIYLYSVIPILVSAWLIYIGLNNYDIFREPSMKGLFSIMPIVLGILTLLVLFMLISHNVGKTIEMSPYKIIYKHRDFHFGVLWGDLTFSEAQPDSIFATILISDGKNFGKIDRLFFSDYFEILRVMKYARRNVKEDFVRL
ncbi:MAG: hypothetical protein M1269_02995 [Chloroflexi bacterium]|nr:hypothetical protein [Chloroflexota bacterium]